MDLNVLQLYEQDFLGGRISAEQVVETLGGVRLPRFFPESLDAGFLDLICSGTLLENTLYVETEILCGNYVVRPEKRSDRYITRLFLEAFDREVIGRAIGLRRKTSCFVLQISEEEFAGALWYCFEFDRKRGKEMYIDRLYVNPQDRGRSYGEALVEGVIAAERKQCTGAVLVAPENVIGFYRRLDFCVLTTFHDEELQRRKFALMHRKL